MPTDVARLNLHATGQLLDTNRLSLVIGLPLHNRVALTNLMQELYDPSSPNFHHYLTLEQFNENFGPTEAEYQTVLQFAKTNGLKVVGTYSHRQLVNVAAAVADIEKAFHVHMRSYQHPTEHRQFFAPDVDPSVDANVPIQNVSGLNNYILGQTGSRMKSGTGGVPRSNGSGPGNFLWGYDFRNAYASNVTMTGSGQYVGLVEMDGYYPNDITSYENASGLRHVPLQNILLPGFHPTRTTIPMSWPNAHWTSKW